MSVPFHVLSEQEMNVASHEQNLNQRYHALDLLRGMMMLALVAFHAALPYGVPPDTGGLTFLDTSEWLKYYVTGGGIRVAIFFVIAGFFCSLLYSRRTVRGFVENTAVRIATPLAIGWAALLPVVGAGILFSAVAILTNKQLAWDLSWQAFREGDLLFPDNAGHLWFLYYLLFFYAGYLAIRQVGGRISGLNLSALQSLTRWAFESNCRALILAVPTILLLQLQPLRVQTSPINWTPSWEFLLLYGSMFAAGAVLFSVRDVLEKFQRGAWWHLTAGLLLMGVFQSLTHYPSWTGASVGVENAMMDIANGFFIWFLFFGIAGVLLRHLNRPNRVARYVADASYWTYLLHLTIVVWMPGLLADYNWAPELSFFAVFATSAGISFLTYELFVRWSIIGKVLNGRTHPSGLAAWVRRRRHQPEPMPA